MGGLAGKYRTIVVDPPWRYGNQAGRQRPDYADRTMGLEEVKRFDVGRWVPEEPCHLYLWVTDGYAGRAGEVLDAWGFSAKVFLVWVKNRMGLGNYFRHQHELCVFATRGQLRLRRRDVPTVFYAKVTRHSEKPAAFYALVEACSPGPYLDVFGRKLRPGWDVFGDEVAQAYQLRLEGSNASVLVGGG